MIVAAFFSETRGPTREEIYPERRAARRRYPHYVPPTVQTSRDKELQRQQWRKRRRVAPRVSAGPVAALLAALGLLFAIFAMAPTAVSGDTPKLPNIVLITIDTLRADHTTLSGYPLPTTPALARLAEQGVSIAPAYAPVSTTAPTHASLFTGRYPHSHHLIKNGLPLAPEAKTLAETLTDHGYQTAAVVSSFALTQQWLN